MSRDDIITAYLSLKALISALALEISSKTSKSMESCNKECINYTMSISYGLPVLLLFCS